MAAKACGEMGMRQAHAAIHSAMRMGMGTSLITHEKNEHRCHARDGGFHLWRRTRRLFHGGCFGVYGTPSGKPLRDV